MRLATEGMLDGVYEIKKGLPEFCFGSPGALMMATQRGDGAFLQFPPFGLFPDSNGVWYYPHLPPGVSRVKIHAFVPVDMFQRNYN